VAVLFKPPGWRAPDVVQRHGAYRFDIAAVQRYDPPLSRGRQVAAGALFVLLLVATSALLWHAHRLALPELAAGAGAIIAGLWAVGALCTPRAVALSPAGVGV